MNDAFLVDMAGRGKDGWVTECLNVFSSLTNDEVDIGNY